MVRMEVIGHLGKDCVVNTVNGKQVINFTVAHSEKYKNAQGVLQEKTLWVDCSWWTESTAVGRYLNKGTQVFVEGEPAAQAFLRNDGTAGSSLKLRVRSMQLLGKGTGGENNNQQPDQGSSYPNPGDITEPVDDLPF